MPESLRKKSFFFSCVDTNQDNIFNSNSTGPQDGGFDTSAWGNYANYYPIQNQYNNFNPNQGNNSSANNNNNTNYNNQSRVNQKGRPNNQRQQASNNSVVVCCCPWRWQTI
jgi:hypothetical protein